MNNIPRLFLLAALAIVLGLAACAEDPFDTNPLVGQVNGLWWSLTEATGTYADGAKDYDYTRIGMAMQFNEDGTGYGITFYFNDEDGDPVTVMGGEGYAPLTYASTLDGRIIPDFSKAQKDYGNYYRLFTFTYHDGVVYATNGTLTFSLEQPSDQMAQTIRDWEQQFNVGAVIDSGFNPNDTDFNLDTWREQEGIYLYDGTGEYSFSHEGRTCQFSLVPLPWYNGIKYTNLPDGFCDDITPENGWELVLNLCGNTAGSLKNNNFFAVYNKYSGILRFFYYLPEGFSTGNDHVWEVSMSDHLAQESVWTYGLPSDRAPIDKATIGQTRSGYYSDYVTPWVKNMSKDGLVVPNVGWWAFDVDLSQLPADGINPDDIISLQMRSWTTTHTTLASTVAASINGSYDGQIDLTTITATASSSKGLIENLSDIVNVGKPGVNAVSSAVEGNYLDAISSGITFAKSLYSVYGAKEPEGPTSSQTTSGTITGSINLGLTGNIDTKGVTSGSNPTVGIASPTIYMKDLDTKNTHMGQGVWNLRTAPVVYWSEKAYPWDSWEYQNNSYRYFCFAPYVFDPNSVEIELNADVFPDAQIEWIEVNSICGARKERQPITSDRQTAIRKAYGVSGPTSRYYFPYDCATYTILGQDDCLWDFFYNSDEKHGLNALNTIYVSEQRHQENEEWTYDWNDKIQGRGIDGYSIEPQVKGSYYEEYHPMVANYYNYLPFLEVNVTVRIKMAGMEYPIVLSRNYLPQIKEYGNGYVFSQNRRENMPYADKMKGHTELYDYQMSRIDDIIERYSLPKSISNDYYYIPYYGCGIGVQGYSKLFDGDSDTKWHTTEADASDAGYFVEFYTHEPSMPAKYFLTTCNDTSEHPERNPKSWKLLAKASADDEWTTIATVTDDTRLPAENHKRVEYSLDINGREWQYYRFEISMLQSGDLDEIQLAEFELGK